ncbi:CHAT domain-containing protein [Flavobacterium sp. 9AF]|uniref:CHAT domain-containing protein n=1 Tax=Flavobacterium sp. 9AF TaxID=2653142 RepID=UPI0012F2AA70|nr:CHAT domain-containing protein [Flavobacterium sp. 9AF]VXB34645.1 CHAT domain-containing protein [Flavobacterium sp. 9AF]
MKYIIAKRATYIVNNTWKISFIFILLLSKLTFAQQDTVAINKEIRNAEKQIQDLMALGKSFELIDAYKTIIQKRRNYLEEFFPKKLANYYLDLSYYYSEVHNQKYEIEYTKEAIAVMNKTQNYHLTDYLTAYNNWYFYIGNYGDIKEAYKIYLQYDIFYKKLLKDPSKVAFLDLAFARRIYDKMQILEKLNANLLDEALIKLNAFYNRINKKSGIGRKEDIDYYMSCYDAFSYKYYEKKDYKNAIYYLEKLQQQGKQFNLPFYEMKANALLGSIHYYLKQYEKGRMHCDLALNNIIFPPFNSSKYSIETIKALNLSGLNRHEEATQIVERIVLEISNQFLKKQASILTIDIEKIKELNSHHYINIFASSSLIFMKKFIALKKAEDLKKAEKLAVIASHMFQEFYNNGEYNERLSVLQSKITETLLFICSQKQKSVSEKKELLNLIERNVSQHLFKEVQKKVLLDNNELTKLYTELEQTQNEKMYYEGLIKDNKDKNAIKTSILEKKITTIKKSLKQDFPNFMQVDADFDFEEVQKKLSDDESIWKFYVADENVYGLWISKKELQVFLLNSINKIKPLVVDLVQEIKQPNTLIHERASKLNTILFPKEIKRDKLAIIPDNFLNYLPFEVVLNKNVNALPVISYYYSFPMWLLSKKAKTGSNTISLTSFAPNYTNNSWFNNQKIPPLPFAQKESQEICNLFDGKQFNNELATKENFLNTKSVANVYHFAMHSFLYENDFSQSCLLFSNNQPLYFSELYNYYIPTDLLVLSACNTGNGKLVNGEGIMSLARAFTYAGVKSSVVSLWQVPDKETSEIMILFYKNLRKGLPKDSALIMAKQEFVKQNPLKNHPYFWAGFVLNGNTTPICKPTSFLWLWLLVGFLFLILMAAVYKRNYSKSSSKWLA